MLITQPVVKENKHVLINRQELTTIYSDIPSQTSICSTFKEENSINLDILHLSYLRDESLFLNDACYQQYNKNKIAG